MPLFGPVLRRIETKVLQDETLSEAEVAACVNEVARVPPLAGITRDRAGNLNLCSFTENAILKMGKDRRPETLIADPPHQLSERARGRA